MFYSYSLLLLLLTFCKSEDGELKFLTSPYSQVSRSGSARGHAGQKPFTYSSSAEVLRKQNIPIRNKPNKKLLINKNIDDGTGEVIERFNPRPWFSYESVPNKEPGPAYIPPSQNNRPVNVPFDSFPLSLPPNNNDKPSFLLKPPFSDESTVSYDSKPVTKAPVPNFVTPNSDYLPPEKEKPQDMKDEDSNDDMDSSPPVVPYSYHPDDHSPSAESYGHSPSAENHDHPPSVQSYDHPPSAENHDNSPPVQSYGHSPSAESYDHPPPAENHDHFPPGIPEYLDHDPNIHGHSFDHHYHDHPVYYEVKTTSTEPPENQRLNKRPYSYYYIGRKLWYIPLYFSVYFIIYIFVLILKSIARHKITFNHYFEDDKREMKDEHQEHEEYVHKLEHHVIGDLGSARRKYIM